MEDIDVDSDFVDEESPIKDSTPNESSQERRPPREDREGQGRAAPSQKGFIKLTPEQLAEDWYAVLNVQHDANDTELKVAYHKRCLDTHPDKDPSRDDTHFKKVVKAYEVLGNAEMRRAFDSAATFDDNIPDEKPYSDAEFFAVFGKCFDRNRKWSVGTAPRIGSTDTPEDEVDAFYKFWFNFKSWRDFSHEVEPVEYDDDCREIRRRVQRENDKQVEKLKRKEAKRVMSLVERAHRLDPRIKGRLLREKQEKEQVAQQKAAAKAAEIERVEQVKREAEAAEKAKEEERKAQLKAAGAKRRTLRAEVHELLQSAGIWDDTQGESMAIKPDKVLRCTGEWLSAKSEDLEALLASLSEARSKGSLALTTAVNESVQAVEFKLRVDRYGQPCKPPTTPTTPAPAAFPTTPAADECGVWTEEQLSALQKAVAKFPGGTVDRWNKMAQFLGGSHTDKQVLLKTKEVENSWGVLKQATTTNGGVEANLPEAWTTKQQKQLEDALRALKDYKEKDKWEKIAEGVEGKTKSDCVTRYKYLAGVQKK